MSDGKSCSSHALSAIEFNSKSLNALDSINPAIINKIKRYAESYSDCARKCGIIWAALTKNDMAGSNLTEKVLEAVFKQFQSELYAFTRINSIREFMRLFDQDKDGALNPDEQIAIFSFIKYRLYLIANNCLQIQEYLKFYSLFKYVRTLYKCISEWQNQLRSKVHNNQIEQYRQEGANKVDYFCARYDKEFEELQATMIQRRYQFYKNAFYYVQELDRRLAQPTEYIKIKPKNRIKELQFQEKLVSLYERVYEALDFRRELNYLYVKYKARVDRLMLYHANQYKTKLQRKHEKMRKYLYIKLYELYMKLIIRMKKDFEVLRKKNNLHYIYIMRLQGLYKKWAERKGVFEPELKRTKKLKQQRNEVLMEFKKKMINSVGKLADEEAEEGATTGKFKPKDLLDATVNFRIASKGRNYGAINVKDIKNTTSTSAKINMYIGPKSSDKNYSLSKMYSTYMYYLHVEPLASQHLRQQYKARKHEFIMSKMVAKG